MKYNVGKTDKIIRIVLGIIIGALGYYFQSWWGLAAIVPFGTVLINFCPLYPIIGASTCTKKE